MSKAIRSYAERDQEKVVGRRLQSGTKGLGYWAAVGWMERKKKEMEDLAKNASEFKKGKK